MKRIRSFLAAVITLSLVAGYLPSMTESGSIQKTHTASAAARKKMITIKAATDFTLKLPANWKRNYVREISGKKKQGSFVAFSSKKCHKETGDGWLFSIMRYRDDSYADLPQYELAGKWNGTSYVAVFPTDVQTEGAKKAAKKQYKKLNAGSYKAALSIQPSKKRKKGKGVYRNSVFSLKLPASWKNNYIVKTGGKNRKNYYAAFYSKKCYNKNKQGWLFSIEQYRNESYRDLPAYELVGKWNGISYVAVFPTDVQHEGASKKAVKQYQTLSKTVEKVAGSIMR